MIFVLGRGAGRKERDAAAFELRTAGGATVVGRSLSCSLHRVYGERLAPERGNAVDGLRRRVALLQSFAAQQLIEAGFELGDLRACGLDVRELR